MVSNVAVFVTIVKSIPVRCVIEVKSEESTCKNDTITGGHTETSTFAIIPSKSLFKDVVKTALIKLGYSKREASAAKGK